MRNEQPLCLRIPSRLTLRQGLPCEAFGRPTAQKWSGQVLWGDKLTCVASTLVLSSKSSSF